MYRLTAALLGLTVALVACGTAPHATPTTSSVSPQSLPGPAGLLRHQKYLHQLRMPSGMTRAELLRRYGGHVVNFDAASGTATIANNEPDRQAFDVAVDPNDVIYGIAGTTGIAGSYGAWATGSFGAWATKSYGAWATGTANTASPTTFAENQPLWDLVKLGGAQTLIPELGRGIKVAVIDTGIDLNHPAFSGQLDLANAKDYLDGDNTPQEVNGSAGGGYSNGYGHGTAVSGIVLQVAPNVTILPIRALDSNGQGDTATVASAVNYAVSAGAQIINLSLGSIGNDSVLTTAVNNALNARVSVIMAVGNTGTTTVLYPGAVAMGSGPLAAGTVNVGSVSAQNMKSSFSAYGSGLEVEAPGENIQTVFPEGLTVSVTGTSFAAPIVAGAVALIRSTGVNISTSADVGTMLKKIGATATPATDPTYKAQLGYGTVNLFKFADQYR